MSQMVSFRHPHMDVSANPLDARAEMQPNILLEDCFSIGFRISTQSRDSFVHAMIFADSYEQLLYGIDQKKDLLHSIPSEQPILKIDVVYLRSMQTLDEEFIGEKDRNEVEELTQNTLRKRDDEHFVVFGVTGKSKLVLMEMQTTDALTAISLARYKRIEAAPQHFTALQVRQAHPATNWFESMFQEASRRMRAIENCEVNCSGMLH